MNRGLREAKYYSAEGGGENPPNFADFFGKMIFCYAKDEFHPQQVFLTKNVNLSPILFR